MDTNYKRTVAGSVGAGLGAIFNASGRTYYILEHKTNSKYHQAGESQKIIVDQIEMGRDSSCQVRFDESFETVSRKHAAIVRDGENWKLVPLSSTNATIVNGRAVQGDYILNSGDEIRLSSQGPVMGFIMPQGNQSLVKSIGLTERMSLFRKQALRPYKTALWILFIVLVLAVGGLVTWNILSAKNYEAQLVQMQLEQQTITEEMAAKEEEIMALMDKLDAAEENANMTDSEIRKLQEAFNKAQEEKEVIEKRIEENQKIIDGLNDKLDAPEERSVEQEAPKAAASKPEPAKPEPAVEKIAETVAPADIKKCYNSVYYIKMDDISIFDKDNKEIVKFATDHLIGGTGFLLDNGRFVTARRVIEPWFYYNGMKELGKDSYNIVWRFQDIQAAQELGCKVVANYTAYAPNGMNFKFKNTDMRGDANFVTNENYYVVESYRINRALYRLYRKQVVSIKRFDKTTKADWVSMAKADQLSGGSGLPYDNALSLRPVGNTEVIILGYPLGSGVGSSESITPVEKANNINVSGLNNANVIELSSRGYQEGNDGAPVLCVVDGKWTVIGVLSHTENNSQRDLVVPISYTK